MTDEEDISHEEKTEKDRWFDQWVIAKGDKLKELIERNIAFLDVYDTKLEPRKRSRKPSDKVRWLAVVEVITCNLAYAVLSEPESGYIAISRSKGRKLTRYDNATLSPKVINRVLDQLENSPILDQSKGTVFDGMTRISPGQWFKKFVIETGVTFEDFGRNPAEELIVLSRNTKSFGYGGKKKKRELLDYKDTEETYRLRSEVWILNKYLEQADIEFIDDGQEPKVDAFQRSLTRNFNLLERQKERFDQGGRLARGFWLNLKKDRRRNIRIQKEQIVALDFSNMFARLAYALYGHEAAPDDLYDLTGILEGYEAHHRKGIKKAFNALLFGASKKLPGGLKSELPEGSTLPIIKKAIGKKHPIIKPLLGTKIGYKLMFQESQILVALLRRLQEHNIVALPLHDAILIAKTKDDNAREVMSQVTKELISQTIPIDSKVYS
jgi:hypothetical protein